MPAWLLKIAPYVIGLVLLVGAYEAWAYHERTLGAAAIEKSNLEALAAQNLKDAATNKALAVKLQARITQLESVAQAAGRAIDLQPVDPGTPADEAAASAVNCMLDQSTCSK
jgi:hypothetical protein